MSKFRHIYKALFHENVNLGFLCIFGQLLESFFGVSVVGQPYFVLGTIANVMAILLDKSGNVVY